MSEKYTPQIELTDNSFSLLAMKEIRDADGGAPEKNRDERKNRLHAIERRVVQDQKVIAEITDVLYSMVRDRKDADSVGQNLTEYVGIYAKKGLIPAEINKRFNAGIEKFKQKRSAVRECIKTHNDNPEEMFIACFGHAPVGKVEVTTGSMTLNFRCYEDEDYINAFAHSVDKTSDTGKKKFEEKRKNALKSIGVAFGNTLVPSLAGTITAERVGDNYTYEPRFKKHTEHIPDGVSDINWYPAENEGNLFYLYVPTLAPIEVHFQKNQGREVESCYLVRHQGSVEIDMGTYHISNDLAHATILASEDPKSPQTVHIKFGRHLFFIENNSGAPVGIEKTILDTPTKVIKDKSLSDEIEVHEDQHQFNKLFAAETSSITQDTPISELGRLEMQLAKHTKSGKEEISSEYIVSEFTKVTARIFRRYYIDTRAKDEILALAKDGSSIETIRNSLKNESLYDYKNREYWDGGKEISGKELVYKKTNEVVEALLGTGFATISTKESYAYFLRNNEFCVTDLQQNMETVKNSIEEILNAHYTKDLERWIRVVESMENAGYSRQFIVSYLGGLPIERWKSNARRFLKHENKEFYESLKPKRKQESVV